MGQTPRRILVLTASAGSGHGVAAEALASALRAAGAAAGSAPVVTVQDVLAISGPFFRKLYAGGYLGLVRHAPSAMGWLYDAMDRPGRHLHESWRLLIQNANRSPIIRFLLRERPDLVVNTHFLPAEIVAQLRRAGRLACRQVTATTDFETHRLWAQAPTERYYTATEEGRRFLMTWGAPEESVRVLGIPIRSAFAADVDLTEFRGRVGLDPDRPLVLLLSGGFGVGPTTELLRALRELPPAAQIAVFAGRNERLRRRLVDAAAREPARRVLVVGYTDEMHAWMRAADVAVSKPGGLTAAEALASALPLVIVNPIPGQESRNSDYLLENGAAIKVNNARLLGYRVSALLADGPRRARLQAAARALGRPHAAAAIARDCLALLDTPA